MKYFSKYPVFFTLLILLLAAFAGIVAYDIYLFNANSKAAAQENRARKAYVAAVQNDPGKEELEKAHKNIEALRARLNLLDKDLSRESSSILAPLPANLEGYQLTERIRSMVQQWKLEAEQKSISIPSADYAFSFKRYLDAGAKAPGADAVAPLWKQAIILDNIMKKLFAAKESVSPLNIISIQREILPSEVAEEKAAAAAAGRRTATRTTRVIRSNTGDTFEIDPFISARKEGNIKTLGYKIVFTGHTDTMRRFLNNLNNYDLMLIVRSVEVKPTVATASKSKTQAVEEAGIDFSAALEAAQNEAAAEGAKVEVRDPVVSENLSEFTVVIEFIEVEKDAPKKPAEQQGESTENTDAKEAE